MRPQLVAAAAVLITLLPESTLAQTSVVPSPGTPLNAVIAAPPPVAGHPNAIFVERDTLIRLMVINEVSTKVVQAGYRFPLRVDEDVIVNGVKVIPVGAKAWGEVLRAEENGVAGKSGKLNVRLLYVDVAGDRVPIRGENKTAGAGGTAETVMGVIGLGPLGLLARGNNAKLKAGEIFNGSFDRDLLFDSATSRLTPAPVGVAGAIIVPTSH